MANEAPISRTAPAGRLTLRQAQQEAAAAGVELRRLGLGLDVVQEGHDGLARRLPEVALVGHVGLDHGQCRSSSASRASPRAIPALAGTPEAAPPQETAQLEVRVAARPPGRGTSFMHQRSPNEARLLDVKVCSRMGLARSDF